MNKKYYLFFIYNKKIKNMSKLKHIKLFENFNHSPKMYYVDLPTDWKVENLKSIGEDINKPYCIQTYLVSEEDIDTDDIFSGDVEKYTFYATENERNANIKSKPYLSLYKWSYEIDEMGLVIESDSISDLYEYTIEIEEKQLSPNNILNYKSVNIRNIYEDDNMIDEYVIDIEKYLNGLSPQFRVVIAGAFHNIWVDYNKKS